jgi:hypothetical protein
MEGNHFNDKLDILMIFKVREENWYKHNLNVANHLALIALSISYKKWVQS